jgi:MFS family permease
MKDRGIIGLLSSLYISTFFIRASFGIMLATLPIYLGITTTYLGYGIVAAASPLFEMATVLFIGTVVDHYGRKVILLLGLLAAGLLLFALSLTTSLYAVFLINAGHGIAAGSILISSLALLTDYAPQDHRGREMGAFDAFNLLGWIAGFALGALFLQFFKGSLHMTFAIAGIMALVAVIYSAINITETKKRDILAKKIEFHNIIAVLRQRSIILVTLPWFIVFMIIGAALTFLTVSTSQGVLTISPLVLAALIVGGGAFLVLTQYFYGRLSDKYGRMPIMIVGTIGFVGIMTVLGIGYLTANPATEDGIKTSIISYWPLLALFGLMALAFGPSALSSLADEAKETMRGVTMAVYSIVISAGMFIGIPAIAAISDHYGGLGVLIFMIASAIAMTLLMTARYYDLKRTKNKPKPITP